VTGALALRLQDRRLRGLDCQGKDRHNFFVDPLTPMPHDVDVKALARLAIGYDFPMAFNVAAAEMIVGTTKNA
jgi:methylglyoxal synthase